MLPYCSDETLVEELMVVIHAGGRLGAAGQDPADVAHLLQMLGSERGLTYRSRAQALLSLIEDAFEAAKKSDVITDESQYGLRILFGVHPDYIKDKMSVREREAAPYLWRREIKPESFRKRHRQKAAALALECLRSSYGQRDAPEDQEYETLEGARIYKVNEHRQLWLTTVTTRFRSRSNLPEFGFFEPVNDDPEVNVESFNVLTDGARLVSRAPSDTRDGYNHIVIGLPSELAVGDEFTISWEERLTLKQPTDPYANYFVAMEAANDNFRLELSVTFDGDPPSTVWAFKAHPSENLRRLRPPVVASEVVVVARILVWEGLHKYR